MSQKRLYEKFQAENGIFADKNENEKAVINETVFSEEKKNRHTFKRAIVGIRYFLFTIMILCMMALSSIAIVLLFNPANRNTIMQIFANLLHFS